MSGVIATIPRLRFNGSSGSPLAGGTLTVYAAGTTTLENTWQDRALSILNTNPITLDGNGSCVVWLDSLKTYKIVLKDRHGATVWTQDDIVGGGVDSSFEISAAAIQAAADVAAAAAAAAAASQAAAAGSAGAVGSAATMTDVVNSWSVQAWGDSLTQASGGQTPWPSQLAALTGVPVTNNGVGGETSTQIKTRLLASGSKQQITVIWAGRNNYTDGATVLADVAAMVSAIGHTSYLVLSVLNGSYAGESVGGAGYNQIAAINASLSSTYGTRYLDIRSALVAAYNPGIPQDVTDFSNDVPPSSLRIDQLHLTTAGYAIVAAQVLARLPSIVADGNRITAGRLREIFNSPPGLGLTTPRQVKGTTIEATSDLKAATAIQLGGTSKFTLGGDGLTFQLNASYYPDATASNRELGAATFKWRNLYLSNVVFADNGVQASDSSRLFPGELRLGASRRMFLAGDGLQYQLETNLLPDSTANNRDLGQDGFRWRILHLSDSLRIGGQKVVGSQQAAIANATDAATAISQLNLVLAALRNHGLIAL